MNHLLVTAAWLLAGMLVLSSCSKDDKNMPTAPGHESSEYMPLAVGNEWVYTYNGTDSIKYKVAGDTTAYGHTYALLAVSGAFTKNAFLRHDDGIYLEGQNFMNMIGDTVTNFIDVSVAYGKNWGQWVPASSKRIMQAWTMYDRDITVKVAAGTFNDVMKISYLTGYLLGPQFITVSNGVYYWSRSTGLVKHEEYASGGTITAELRSYTLK